MPVEAHIVGIVEDDDRVLESLGDLIASAGHGVRLFSSAEQFLEGPGVGEVDCIISDVSMPGLSGLDLLARVTKARPQLPVILISARQDEHQSQIALRDGARYFFEKPFDTQLLLRAVDTVLNSAASAQSDVSGG